MGNLLLLADGLSNDEIARELNKNTGSIKFHTSGIYKKLKVDNRQQAINVARSIGIVKKRQLSISLWKFMEVVKTVIGI